MKAWNAALAAAIASAAIALIVIARGVTGMATCAKGTGGFKLNDAGER